MDPPKATVKDAIEKLHKAHVRVMMVTGDHPHTAKVRFPSTFANVCFVIRASPPLFRPSA